MTTPTKTGRRPLLWLLVTLLVPAPGLSFFYFWSMAPGLFGHSFGPGSRLLVSVSLSLPGSRFLVFSHSFGS